MKVSVLKQKKADLIEQIEHYTESAAFSKKGFATLKSDLHQIEDQIEAIELAREFSAGSTAATTTRKGGFASLGEQLVAVRKAASGVIDSRLTKAATETDPSTGGFLVQTDFVNDVWTRVYDNSEILKRVRRLTITTGANSLKYPAVAESSRANGSRYGGVVSYWQPENQTITPSMPAFRMMTFDLKRVSCLLQASDEIMQDTGLFTNIATRAFSDELQFRVEDAMFEGPGGDIPQGFTNCPAVVVQAQDASQTALLTMSNIVNMLAHTFPNADRYVWLCNQDVLPAIYQLSLTVGSGFPMYIGMGEAANAPKSSLFGLPLIPVEYCSTLGTQNDLVLVNLDEYLLVDKSGPDASWNPYIYWDMNMQGFKMTWRVDGQPLWATPLTPFKGATTKSAYITLQTRT